MPQINLKCLFSMAEDESGNHISCHILQNFIQIILFTYLYNSNPAYDSGLQNAIDKILKSKNIFFILCGSEVSVIEEIIDDSTKPLYGRKTSELKLLPFTYKEAREFFPHYSNEDALTAYSILGGIPLYLSLFDDRLTIKENVIKNCLSTTGYLFNEIETLLRMELKENLQDSALCVTQQNKSYIIFSKNGVSSSVEKHLKNLPGYSVVTLDDLF